MTVASGDDLIEEVGSLLIERKIAELVDDQQSRFGVNLEFANQGMIDLEARRWLSMSMAVVNNTRWLA